MAEIWGAVAAAAVGAGVALYGSNRQAQSNRSAQDQNVGQQQQQNNAAWSNWLMTRGIAPTSQVNAGVMPTAGNFQAVNTRLPLWANVDMPTQNPAVAARPNNAPFLIRT